MQHFTTTFGVLLEQRRNYITTVLLEAKTCVQKNKKNIFIVIFCTVCNIEQYRKKLIWRKLHIFGVRMCDLAKQAP